MQSSAVLAMDFGGSKTALAVADPDTGERLGVRTLRVRSEDSASETFDRAVSAARDLLTRTAPGRTLTAVGACTFGIPRADGIDLAPTIAGWERLAFGDRLRQAFPLAELRMATDVKAAARAEAAHGALAGHDPAIYLNLGTGVAAAIVVGGEVVSGRHGAAGEIGYNVRSVDDVVGPDAAAGTDETRPAALPLEAAIGGKALAASAAAALDGADVPMLFERAARDPRAGALVDSFCRELGFHLANLAIAVDPSRIAVGGGLTRVWDRIAAPLRTALERAVPFPPDLVLAADPFEAPLVGALDLAVEAHQQPITARVDVLVEGAHA
jgi:glucokinase